MNTWYSSFLIPVNSLLGKAKMDKHKFFELPHSKATISAVKSATEVFPMKNSCCQNCLKLLKDLLLSYPNNQAPLIAYTSDHSTS